MPFREYALFVLFFPQLIAGPIVHFRELMPQFAVLDGRPRAEDFTAVATGRLIFSIPYAKLWSPESPHLYDLHIRLYDGEDLDVPTYIRRGISLKR